MADVESTIHRLYETEFAALVRHASYIVGSREIAEEVVQEAFIRLMTKPPRDTNRVAAWLRTVVNNLALDHVRRVKVEERVTERISMSDQAPTVEEVTMTQFDRERVQQSLGALSERDQKALLLRHSGYSYKEIAEKINCPVEQVGVILIRALKKLKQAYLGDNAGSSPAREVQA
ncbi:sigma-70 family RNA polymerase sigma factor [Sulfobacillus harzensis]|uniref:Sigma-70 family RNA polymerase sigma factor n=1 Tax=Sulfobacillus harzensis TaxID=2729629 RepID=A0A7Y0L5M4_9FIRM|nr:sigma-70 family RNA polymerase sigma factor [Sulfobacillus harzensis]NMP22920.1 sigma-70 family RNA polymerase sigma factor [Sulfobacillus harzensis]